MLLFLDVREPPRSRLGKVPGALAIRAASLELRARYASALHAKAFAPAKTVVAYCARGTTRAGRSADEMAPKTSDNPFGFRLDR